MNTDPVLVGDDDFCMEPVEVINEVTNKTMINLTNVKPVEVIDLDDDDEAEQTTTENNNDIVIIEDKTENSVNDQQTQPESAFRKKLKINKLMGKIVTKCFEMDQAGMPRVINRTLLPLYRTADVKFKQTEAFRRLLKNTLKLLERDPDHKFLHIKTLCEELKPGNCRRKVPFVTLATNLKLNGALSRDNAEIISSSRVINENTEENSRNNTHVNAHNSQGNNCNTDLDNSRDNCSWQMANDQERKKYVAITENKQQNRMRKLKAKQRTCNAKAKNAKRKKKDGYTIDESNKTVIIDLDDSDNEGAISVSNDRNDIVLIDKAPPSETGSENSNKENHILQNEKENISNTSDYEHLTPQSHVEIVYENEDTNIPSQVLEIEKEIAAYKEMITTLETTEVTSDHAVLSPYMQCSKYKSKIVQLYKKICEITGNRADLVKRREVQLKVTEGHPPGPAKRLEQFLNQNIDDKTGLVSFPDFTDVVECVFQANFEDNLGWDKQQVFQEAVTLFRECGQALRKSRQKREYKDLLSLVRDKELEDDPADKDPVLLAKLEQNKQIAKLKEEEVLERYVNMENKPRAVRKSRQSDPVVLQSQHSTKEQDGIATIATAPIQSENSGANETICSTNTDNAILKQFLTTGIWNINSFNTLMTTVSSQREREESSDNNDALSNTGNLGIIGKLITNATSNMHGFSTTITTVPVQFERRESLENNEIISNINTEDLGRSKVLVVDGSSSMNEIQNYISCASHGTEQIPDSSVKETETENVKKEVKIKKEPLDIQKMLDDLGDNFISAVFDIEDPFLAIEISSDGFSDDES